MREVLLRDSNPSDEDTLDFSDLAKKMTAQLVPAFCTAAEVLVLESLIGDNEVPAHGPDANVPLRRLHVKHDRENPAWQAAFPVGEILRLPGRLPLRALHRVGRAGPRGGPSPRTRPGSWPGPGGASRSAACSPTRPC